MESHNCQTIYFWKIDTHITTIYSFFSQLKDPCQDDYDDIDLTNSGFVRSTAICQNGDDNGIKPSGQTTGKFFLS